MEPQDFGVDNFDQLLRRWVKANLWCCQSEFNIKDKASTLNVQAGGFGGDTTWALMGHYKDNLTEAIEEVLRSM